jgi:hypothetical protein
VVPGLSVIFSRFFFLFEFAELVTMKSGAKILVYPSVRAQSNVKPLEKESQVVILFIFSFTKKTYSEPATYLYLQRIHM